MRQTFEANVGQGFPPILVRMGLHTGEALHPRTGPGGRAGAGLTVTFPGLPEPGHACAKPDIESFLAG